MLSAAGVRPLDEKVAAIRDAPLPRSKRAVQRWLGTLNFYRRFLPNIAQHLGPLIKATTGPKKDYEFEPSEAFVNAFNLARDALALAVMLHHPVSGAETAVSVDASADAMGAELAQRGTDRQWRPLVFFSKGLTAAEQKYLAFDRELLAVFSSIKHFRHYIEGRPFTVYTDHRPLCTALTSGAERSPRQTRHLEFIAEFTSDIRHVSGVDNVVADSLSRPYPDCGAVSAVLAPEVDYAALSAAQPQLADAREAFPSLSLDMLEIGGARVLCDFSGPRPRPLVHEEFRFLAFSVVHSLSHCGPKPCAREVALRWADAIPLANVTAAACARALVRGWISRFGVPDDVTSDRGAQFMSQLWAELGSLLGMELRRTTAYHPQCNGLVECWRSSLKASLKAGLGDDPAWMNALPLVLLGLRAAWREGGGLSAAEMVYGAPLCLPGECLAPSPREVLSASELPLISNLRDKLHFVVPPPVLFHGEPPVHVPTDLAAAEYVYVRHDAHRGPLQRPYDGPFRVLERHPKHFVLDLGGRPSTVTVDRLKVAYGVSPADVALPRPRGRPRLPRPRDCAVGDTRGEAQGVPVRQKPQDQPQIHAPDIFPPLGAPAPVVPRSGRNVRRPARFNHFVTYGIVPSSVYD
ncbi:uncharacterized protein LOC131892638 [Tigriopus californicus]|uniref:uncharacterized protein LOC131892638 n=1 Tax=Tigriopus californicus TaxID=6832 RepID=UPI0027DA92D7|nr:uncharacterized protein LOC131892638 [Tigriopus californicus]